jgi:hypothetical protein
MGLSNYFGVPGGPSLAVGLDTPGLESNGTWPMRRLFIVTLGIALTGLGACSQESIDTVYWPAMYTSIYGVSNDVEVFPPGSEPFRISLPFPLGVFTFNSDGGSLYADDMDDILAMLNPKYPRRAGLFKIDLNPVHVAAVPGSSSFVFHEIVTSANGDGVLISAGQFGGVCGIFKLNIPDGSARLIVKAPSCDAKHP